MARALTPFRGEGGGRFSPRAPGESLRIVNRAITDDDRRRRQARQKVEAVEERKREERLREGDW